MKVVVKNRKFLRKFLNIKVVSLVLLAIALPTTFYLIGHQLNIRNFANTTPSPAVPFEPFVENFESGTLSGWSPVTESGTSVSVTQAAAFDGNYGFYVNALRGDDARINRTIPQTPQIYTRFRVKLLRDTTPRFGQQLFRIGQGGEQGGVSIHTRSDNGYINRLQGYDPGGNVFDTGIDLSSNQWHTFEIYLEPGLQGKLTIWLDGNPTPVFEKSGNWNSTPIDSITIGSDGGSDGNEYYFDDFAMSNATKIGDGTPNFGIGPVRTQSSPSGNLAETTTQTILSLQTNLNSTCKYSTTNNIEYDAYPNTFSSTGGTIHSQQITGLTKGNSYKYYVRCADTSGTKNLDDYLIYFTIPFGSLGIDSNTSITLIPNYEAMSVYAKYTGDADKNASAHIYYRETGSNTWKKGMRMTPERREAIPAEFRDQFKGVIFGLQPRTSYDVEVRFTDPGGINGSTNSFAVSKSITTRDDNPPLGTIVTTPSTTNLNITTSGTPDKWITYTPPTGQQATITGTVTINANYIRLKGFNFSGGGNIRIEYNASNIIIENNSFVTTRNVIREGGAYSGTSATSENITIQNNTFTIPAGTTQASKFIDFVNNTKGGHVIRKNTFKDLSGVARVSGQYWDCIGGAPNFSIYGFVHRDSDINDNYFEGCNDDQLESDGGNMNVRIWNNTFNGGLNALQTMSVDPTLLGPLYVVRNVSYGEHLAGFAKLGSDSVGNIYFYHNTHYSTPSGQGFKYANPIQKNITSRNNIMQVNRYTIELTDGGSTNSFDYDNLYTTDPTRFAKWDGNSTYDTLAKFQTIIQQVNGFGDNISSQKIGQEKNGYNFNMVSDRINGFVNPNGNDLRLLSTSSLIDRGELIDGINNPDSPWPFNGNAPDIGKYETGVSGQPIATPTPTRTAPTPTPTTGGGIGGINPTSSLSFSPTTTSKSVGGTFSTNVLINTQNSVTNADIALAFNPSILEITSVSMGGYLTEATEVVKTIDNTNGKLFYSLYTDISHAKSGTGTLINISWRAKGAGTSVIAFDPNSTIVYGVGEGNTITSDGLGTATYTVTSLVNPTATPTNPPSVPTATPTPRLPTASPTPQPQACELKNATWGTISAGEGEPVSIHVTTNGAGSCIGKQVSFEVRENDSVAEGGLDDATSTNPPTVSITGASTSTIWNAEWQNDCAGFCNPNEFFFNASIVNQSGSTIRSSEPYLTVNQSQTPIYTLQVQLSKNVTVPTISNVEITVSTSQNKIEKTIALTATNTKGLYLGQLPLSIDPGTYSMFIKMPKYLVKKYTVNIVNTNTVINLSNIALVAGDVNNDNVINTLDLGQMIEEYSPEVNTTTVPDITFDNRVNALDLGLVIENYFKEGDSPN